MAQKSIFWVRRHPRRRDHGGKLIESSREVSGIVLYALERPKSHSGAENYEKPVFRGAQKLLILNLTPLFLSRRHQKVPKLPFRRLVIYELAKDGGRKS